MLMAMDSLKEAEATDERGSRIPPLPRMTLVASYTTDEVGQLLATVANHSCARRVKSAIGGDGIDGLVRSILLIGTVPDAVIVEMRAGDTAALLLGDLERIAPYCGEATQVIVIGHHNDIALYRQLKSIGAADYLVTPMNAADLIKVVGNHVRDRRVVDGAIGTVTLVVGARGGIGATSIAANLAWMAARSGSSLLVDLSAPMASIPGVLGLQPDYDQSRMFGEGLDVELLDKLTMSTDLSPNLGIVSAEADFRSKRDTKGVLGLIQTARQAARSVTVDLPAWLIGPDTHAVLSKADHLVLVLSPDFAGMPRASALIREIRAVDGPEPTLVLGQVGIPGRADWSVAEVSRALGLKAQPVITIPFDPHAFGAAEAEGTLVAVRASASSATGKALRSIFERVAPGDTPSFPLSGSGVAQEEDDARTGFLRRLLSKLLPSTVKNV